MTNSPDFLSVRIVSPTGETFTSLANSVSSSNSSGPFDILPGHASFVTLINNDPIVIITSIGQKKEFRLVQAIIHVHKNQVDIYTES